MFDNTVKVEWPEGEERLMRLTESVTFTDKNGKDWTAGIGNQINGANIPSVFWSIIGSPFIGFFRRASVLHDVYCMLKSEPHEMVHQMFYEAMLEDGTAPILAEKMYLAVAIFGPKWDMDGNELEVIEPENGIDWFNS